MSRPFAASVNSTGRRIAVVLLALMFAVATSAESCDTGSGNSAPDAGELEDFVQERLSSGTVDVTDVNCPEVTNSAEGSKLTCRARDDEGDDGYVEIVFTKDSYRIRDAAPNLLDNVLEDALINPDQAP